MRVLVIFECSGVVRRAFQVKGHESYSCDLKPAEDGSSNHFQCDWREVIGNGWDLVIAHPECTHLAGSGAFGGTVGMNIWIKVRGYDPDCPLIPYAVCYKCGQTAAPDAFIVMDPDGNNEDLDCPHCHSSNIH